VSERWLVDRPAVDALRRALARERVLLEIGGEQGEPDWRAVTGAEPFDWSPPSALAGAKRFFFPPRETLLSWRGDELVEATPRPSRFVLFGVRPCDLAAIAVQDRVFAGDPWYARRRADALLVGLDCLAACAGGFCRDVEAGPFAHAGFDLQLTPLGAERVVVTVGSARGHDAFAAAGLAPLGVAGAQLGAAAAGGADAAGAESASGDVASVDAGLGEALAAAEAAARASFPERAFVARAQARLARGEIADAEWQALGPACFACTGCTSLCPTCSCFTVVDEACGEEGVRARVWDSCLLDGFQREASGHHPAPRPGDRVRRFWQHKLSRDFVPALGRVGCVGCGRCEVTCPGSIGALHVLARLGA